MSPCISLCLNSSHCASLLLTVSQCAALIPFSIVSLDAGYDVTETSVVMQDFKTTASCSAGYHGAAQACKRRFHLADVNVSGDALVHESAIFSFLEPELKTRSQQLPAVSVSRWKLERRKPIKMKYNVHSFTLSY